VRCIPNSHDFIGRHPGRAMAVLADTSDGHVIASRGSFNSAWRVVRDKLCSSRWRAGCSCHVVAELKGAEGNYRDGVQEVRFECHCGGCGRPRRVDGGVEDLGSWELKGKGITTMNGLLDSTNSREEADPMISHPYVTTIAMAIHHRILDPWWLAILALRLRPM
jgi:hypothetical protein